MVVVEDCGVDQSRGRAASGHAVERVANRPIIDHVVDALCAAGIEQLIVVGTGAELVPIEVCLAARHVGLPIEYVEAQRSFDFGEALRAVAPTVGSAPCIVHLGTGLVEESLVPLVRRIRPGFADLVLTVHHAQGPASRLSSGTRSLLRVAELHPERSALTLAGICVFGHGALRRVSSITWKAGDEIDLTTAAARVAAGGGSFEVLPLESWQHYAGDPLDLLELNRIALDRLQTDLQLPDNGGNRIEGRVSIHPQAAVRESVIVGPAVIGDGASISDAYIGPYTSIGAKVRIEGAEVERSIIGDGASITHVGGRIVASVVGRDARIFRDFSLPRAFRLRVGDRTEVALC